MVKVKTGRKLMLVAATVALTFTLTACNVVQYELKDMKSKLAGIPSTMSTYNEAGEPIDRIIGDSIDIGVDSKFSMKDSEGKTTSKSGVLDIIVGSHQVTHVGSSMIIHENGLKDVYLDYSNKVDIKNTESSLPIVNRMVNDFKNATTGKKRLIVIRSQSGAPLAAFAGNSVSTFTTDIDKSTALLVDDQLLFVYRCDYTMYDIALLENSTDLLE